MPTDRRSLASDAKADGDVDSAAALVPRERDIDRILA
jgi:hypothetical protein